MSRESKLCSWCGGKYDYPYKKLGWKVFCAKDCAVRGGAMEDDSKFEIKRVRRLGAQPKRASSHFKIV